MENIEEVSGIKKTHHIVITIKAYKNGTIDIRRKGKINKKIIGYIINDLSDDLIKSKL